MTERIIDPKVILFYLLKLVFLYNFIVKLITIQKIINISSLIIHSTENFFNLSAFIKMRHPHREI